MIKIPGMLVVGAAGRGAGKTKFACEIIRQFSSQCKIIGVKVTAIEEQNKVCPHGEKGCGVCSSLEGHYLVTEENDSSSEKDSGRMLAAGVSRVFWVRALKTHLKEAITALLDIVGDDAVLVCESNSLRKVVEPGLFVMVRSSDAGCKPSAKEVIQYADRVVFFDGSDFDIDLSEISIVDGRWGIKTAATAIIMAGGESSRMGRDKSMMAMGDKPMIQHIAEQLSDHFNQIIISANDAARYSFLDAKIVGDRIVGQGPLMGIASALEASANEVNFVIACDIPQIDISLVKTMLREAKDVDVVVPRTASGRCEPLFAVYRKSVLGIANELLSAGGRKIADIFERCRVKYVELSDSQWLKNLNTIEDYRTMQEQTK